MKAGLHAGMVAALALWGAGAGAQEPVPAPLPPALSIVATDTTVAPFERPNGALLRPGTVTYDLSSAREGQVAGLGARTVAVTESNVGGLPVWLITETRTGTAVATLDSLFLARADLSPQRWVATSGRAQLAASWVRDTAFGALQTYQGRSSFTIGAGGALLVTPGMVERVVELLPLHAGYRAAASLLVVESGSPRVLPGELSVLREESLPAGDHAVDCWVVALRSGASEERLWVTKEMPRVVKTEQSFPTGVVTAVVRP